MPAPAAVALVVLTLLSGAVPARAQEAPAPDPSVPGRPAASVDVAKALPIAYTMAIALVSMSALLIYADLVAPVKLQ